MFGCTLVWLMHQSYFVRSFVAESVADSTRDLLASCFPVYMCFG